MTPFVPPPPSRPVSHKYMLPVVRELPSKPTAAGNGTAW
jgi:hypothetical protein